MNSNVNKRDVSREQLQNMLSDMAHGFAGFTDKVLRGRDNKTILNSSIGLGAMEMGVPDNLSWESLDFSKIITNNSDLFTENYTQAAHPLFSLNPEKFTIFGLDFTDFWRQLKGKDSNHHEPYYNSGDSEFGEPGQSVAESIGLPDLPYGEMAHFAHMGMALYDTGRTFQDLWNEPALKHNVLKIMTHPEMAHTLLFRGTMLTVMGLLHPLGPVVAIGVGYLCAHLVHSAFKLLEGHKDAVREIENVPVLKHIYNATGMKEWAEAKDTQSDLIDDEVDPFEEMPEIRVEKAQTRGVIDPLSVIEPNRT